MKSKSRSFVLLAACSLIAFAASGATAAPDKAL